MKYDNKGFKIPKEKECRVIIDTDAKNEADDQFAIVQAMLSPKFDNIGFIAAHYGTHRDSDSMERSYDELVKLFDLAQCPYKNIIYKGAPCALKNNKTPIESEGCDLIIKEALKDDDRPLYLLFLGAITDLASALLKEPKISNRLTAIWIGGGNYPNGCPEFNLGNDIIAANIVFSSKVELWQVPKNIYEMMSISFTELLYNFKIKNKNQLGEYLFDQLVEFAQESASAHSSFRSGETWVLGDSPAVGLLLNEHRFDFDYIQAPTVGPSMEYLKNPFNRMIRVYNRIDSRLIFEDMFAKVALFDPKYWV